jgi:hypothetical protein
MDCSPVYARGGVLRRRAADPRRRGQNLTRRQFALHLRHVKNLASSGARNDRCAMVL